MSVAELHQIKTISELHRLVGLLRPEHPLISVINLEDVNQLPKEMAESRMFDFYTISLKRNFNGNFKYGQQQYEVQGGAMFFMAPGQISGPLLTDEEQRKNAKTSGWGLYIHPDVLWNTPLSKKIRKYEYFNYSVNEALCLSEKEECTIISLLQTIQMEYFANIDRFSQEILISLIEVLLNYADRFYHRQFLTRKLENHQLLDRLEDLLNRYFNSSDLTTQRLPSVPLIAEHLNLSPNYLSSLLKVLTGRNTQQHIQDKIIEKAKQKIAATRQTVSEISYELGFDHPQSFSRLFKTKTGLSPLAFRQSFNQG